MINKVFYLSLKKKKNKSPKPRIKKKIKKRKNKNPDGNHHVALVPQAAPQQPCTTVVGSQGPSGDDDARQ